MFDPETWDEQMDDMEARISDLQRRSRELKCRECLGLANLCLWALTSVDGSTMGKLEDRVSTAEMAMHEEHGFWPWE